MAVLYWERGLVLGSNNIIDYYTSGELFACSECVWLIPGTEVEE